MGISICEHIHEFQFNWDLQLHIHSILGGGGSGGGETVLVPPPVPSIILQHFPNYVHALAILDSPSEAVNFLVLQTFTCKPRTLSHPLWGTHIDQTTV